jgi:hypothetical protein
MVEERVREAELSEALPNIRPSAHAANACLLADGRLFVNWYAGTMEGTEDQVIVATCSACGGWELPQVLVGRFRFGGEDWLPEIGVPVADGNRVTLYFWAVPLSGFQMGVWRGQVAWRRRIDRVHLFTTEVTGLVGCPPGAREAGGREPRLLLPEANLVLQGSAVELPSGRWLLPAHTEGGPSGSPGTRLEGVTSLRGEPSAAGASRPGEAEPPRRGRFLRSDPARTSWEVVGDLFAEPGCLEPALTLRPDGRLLCYMRTAGAPWRIWYAESRDEGGSWSPVLATNLRNPGSGVDVASSSSGRLLVVSNDSERLRTPLTVGISEDEGRTWLTRDVETGPGEFSYPKLLQTQDGLWHLFYTYQRTHIQHLVFGEGFLAGGRQVPGFPS